MSQVIRISLLTYDALRDSDPRHFSLISDEDNILIKEQSRGSASVADGVVQEISHNLGYFPHFYAYGEISSGKYEIINGHNLFGSWRCHVDNNKLYIRNTSGSTGIIRYFIFYDDVPE